MRKNRDFMRLAGTRFLRLTKICRWTEPFMLGYCRAVFKNMQGLRARSSRAHSAQGTSSWRWSPNCMLRRNIISRSRLTGWRSLAGTGRQSSTVCRPCARWLCSAAVCSPALRSTMHPTSCIADIFWMRRGGACCHFLI